MKALARFLVALMATCLSLVPRFSRAEWSPVLLKAAMFQVRLAQSSVKAVKVSTSFQKARCVKAWRVTRVVLAVLPLFLKTVVAVEL